MTDKPPEQIIAATFEPWQPPSPPPGRWPDFVDSTDGTGEAPQRKPRLKPVSVFDCIDNPSPPPAFVWAGYLPCSEVSLLGAHGGVGKSTIALMLAVCAGLGRPLFGVDTVPCKVLYTNLEDSAAILRHRLAGICRAWLIDPATLQDRLFVVDGTEHPELFEAESRAGGDPTHTYRELRDLVTSGGFGLVIVDNASDAFAGDEIVRRQVRAFIRSLKEIAKLSAAALLLLSHVDKSTSRAKSAQVGESYSGSTAWHNSVRSRLFLSRCDDGLLTLEHQKSNLGMLREPLTLAWVQGGLPQVVGDGFSGEITQGRTDDDKAISLLKLIAEFESRSQYCSPATTSRNHVHAMLKSEPAFLNLKLRPDDVRLSLIHI